jgi:predicted anti-sigma-YlaC factor YlaD
MRLDRELACREVVELVTAYLDDGLAPSDRERFEEHLVFCDGCGNYLEAAGHVQLALPPELEERLLEAFRGWRTS